MCFRAVRTKAALGKGRGVKPKWRTLSRVLENLGFMDSSALWTKGSQSAKGTERL